MGIRRRRLGAAGAREHSPSGRRIASCAQMKTPTLVITNELDYRVPVDQGLQLFTALRRTERPEQK